VLAAAMPLGAGAQDPGAGPNAHHEAARIVAAEIAMHNATADLHDLIANKPVGLAATIRYELRVAAATYRFREAARQEQLRVNELAAYASVEKSVVPLLPNDMQQPISDMVAGLHSLYILGGIDQYYLVNVHFRYPYSAAAPLASLRSYYVEAQNLYGVDASYLASINYIESNFGRNNGPSSAGAQGPMQFLPATWRAYSLGGEIDDPHDSILGAANYLRASGAPGNLRRALYAYNHSKLYVEAVLAYARVMRRDLRAFYGFHAWQVFVRTPDGYRRITSP
jgi:membrane-bound lytic murein transglycosylase B